MNRKRIWTRRPSGACARLRRAAACVATSTVAALGVLGAGSAGAVVFPNLYTLTVTPEPGAGNMRAAAEDLAFRQLLVRITGDRDAGSDPQLQGLIENASNYVFSYAQPDRQRAAVGFYPNDVNRALEGLGRSVWGPERPLTLLWVAIDGGQGERTLLSANEAPAGSSPQMSALTQSIRSELQRVADERGLPIVLPLLDLEDMSSISFADVSGGFTEQIEAASVRYGADAILVGHVRVTPYGNDVEWLLLRGDERRTFFGSGGGSAIGLGASAATGFGNTAGGAADAGGVAGSGPNGGAVTSGEAPAGADAAAAGVAEGLHWVADVFAQDFSVLGGVRTVRILVRDVDSLADYGRVVSYLEGLSALEAIDVDGLDGDLLSLRASARGELGVLERMLSLGRVLRLDTSAVPPSEGGSNTLVLRVAQ